MRTLGLIPARAGSRGIPHKNTRVFDGMALAAKAIDIGHRTCDAVCTTTNDLGVIAIASGHLILRPEALCQDDTPMLAVVQHALTTVPKQYDTIVLLQPTQPLRRKEHVIDALRLLEETGADSVVSVVQIPAHYSPDYACEIAGNTLGLYDGLGKMDRRDLIAGYKSPPPLRRQDCRPAYSRDGTVYAIKRKTIEAGSLYGSHCVPLIIPPNESCNLDTEEDWQRAEAMVRK